MKNFIEEFIKPLGVCEFLKERVGLNLGENQKMVLRTLFETNAPEIVLLVGKGGSKDFLSACATLYQIYKLLIIPSPQEYFSMAPGSPIDVVVVGPSGKQTKNVFLTQFIGMLKNSKWFMDLPDMKIKADAVIFPDVIRVQALNSTVESFEGSNAILGILDEFSAFTSVSKTRNSEIVYDRVKSTILSRFGDKGKLFILSFPRAPYENDPTVLAYEEIQNGTRDGLGYKFSTWELNPRVSREDLEPFFKRDPASAELTFMCIPPTGPNPNSFLDPDLIKKCIKRVGVFDYESEVKDGFITNTFYKDSSHYIYHCGIDAGIAADSFAVALLRDENNRIIIDDVLVWKPHDGSRVDFLDVLKFLEKLEYFTMSTDGYNSGYLESAIHHRRKVQVDVIGFSAKKQYELYGKLKSLMLSNRIEFPNREILKKELEGLTNIRENKIDHLSGGSKDTTDAIVLALAGYEKYNGTLDGYEDDIVFAHRGI